MCVAVNEVVAPRHAKKIFVHGHTNPFLSVCFLFILANTMRIVANLLTRRSILLYAELGSLTDGKVLIVHYAHTL